MQSYIKFYVSLIVLITLVCVGCDRKREEVAKRSEVVIINPILPPLEEDILRNNVNLANHISKGYKKLVYLPYRTLTSDNVLLLYFKSEGDSHASSSKVKGVLLSRKSDMNSSDINSWQVDVIPTEIGDIGGFGLPGNASIIKVGNNNYALAIMNQNMSMGIYSERLEMFLIDKNGFRDILSLKTHLDTDDMGIDKNDTRYVKFDITCSTVIDNTKEFYDISIKLKGDGHLKEMCGADDLKYFDGDYSKTVIMKYTDNKYYLDREPKTISK
jgi:hypothetical protein